MFTSISRFLMVIVFALSLVALLGSISTVNATAQRHDPVIEVVVTDINHQPIAGAFVAIYDITSMQGGLARLVATGTSDAAGKIALTLAGERSLAMQRLYSNIADQTLYSISDYQITVATVAQGAIARDVHTLSYTFADHERLALVNPNLSGAEVQSLVEEAEAGANEFKVDMTPVEPQMTPFAVYTQPDRSMSPTSPQQQAIECRLPVSLEQTPWGEG